LKRGILAITAIILTIVLTSCGVNGKHTYAKIYDKYSKDLTSFSAVARVTVASNLTVKEYKVEQLYRRPDKFKVEVLSPETSKGAKYIFADGKLRFVPPAGVSSVVSELGNYVPSDKSYMFVPDFFDGYVKSEAENYTVVRDVGGRQTVLDAVMKNDNIYRFSQKLWVDNKTLLPSKLETYDINGKPTLTVVFEDFKWNEKLDDEIFKN